MGTESQERGVLPSVSSLTGWQQGSPSLSADQGRCARMPPAAFCGVLSGREALTRGFASASERSTGGAR